MNEEVKITGSFKGVLVASVVVIGALLAASFWAWLRVAPDAKIPVHWGVSGEADGFGSRNFLFFTPAVLVGVVLLFAVIPRFEPRRGNLLRSSKAYKATWYGMLGFFALLHGAMVYGAIGNEVPMMAVVSIGMGALFVLVGNYLGKVRSNFFFGVRTPWTLSSELSWNKTHRVAGRIMVAWGVVLAISGLVDSTGTSLFWLIMGGSAVLLAVILPYSYLAWKRDPERGEAVWTRKNLGE